MPAGRNLARLRFHAVIALGEVYASHKQYHDVVGGDQSLNVFDLRVDQTRRTAIRSFGERITDETIPASGGTKVL